MREIEPDRRTALKALALLGVGATGGTGAAAARGGPSAQDDRTDGEFYVAFLRPREGVESNAHGVAVAQRRQDAVKFVLNVVALENAFMAHIHEDETLGPIAVWLYEFETQEDRLEEGRFSGMLDVGTITDDVVEEGRAEEAESESVDDLLGKMDAGEAFANVHTEQYPDGAIAGQFRRFDPRAVMERARGSAPGSY